MKVLTNKIKKRYNMGFWAGCNLHAAQPLLVVYFNINLQGELGKVCESVCPWGQVEYLNPALTEVKIKAAILLWDAFVTLSKPYRKH